MGRRRLRTVAGMFFGLVVVAAVVGALIGAAGVGGVLLPPALIILGGITPHQATAMSLSCMLLAAVISVIWYARRPVQGIASLTWRLAIGLVPGALAGARLAHHLPATAIEIFLAATALLSGLWILIRRRISAPVAPPDHGTATLIAVGFVAGVGSAMTGTSGPVLLVPALMLLGYAARPAIAAGQIAQIAVIPPGVAGSLGQVGIDLPLTAILSVIVALGVVAGMATARRIPESPLKTTVAALLITTAAIITLRLALT